MERPSRVSEMRQALEEAILNGALAPGERLDERALAERFGVSRTPVREALSQLSSAGLVQIRPGAGATVVRLSPRQVVGMMEVLIELEGLAATLCARRMTLAERDELANIHTESGKVAETGDPIAYDACNRRLHGLIYAGSRNEHLEQQARHIRDRLRIYRGYPFLQAARPLKSHAEHGRIIRAILDGDDEGAGRAARDHMTTGGNIFVDMVASMPSNIGDE